MHIVTYALPREGDDAQEYRGKFVQLVWRGEEYLVFAPFSVCGFHVEVLKLFLQQEQISFRQHHPEAALTVREDEVQVLGGGRFKLCAARRHLELWDNSQVYGRFQAAGLAQKLAAAAHPWHGFECEVH